MPLDDHFVFGEMLDLGVFGDIVDDLDVEVLQDLDPGQDQRDVVGVERQGWIFAIVGHRVAPALMDVSSEHSSRFGTPQPARTAVKR